MVAFYNQGDQELYKTYQYLPQEKYRLGLNLPEPKRAEIEDTFSKGIPAASAFTNSGGGTYYTGTTNNLIEDYNKAVRDQYFGSQPTPLVDDLYQSKLDKTFLGFPSYQEQQLTGPDLGEYIGTDTDVPLEFTTAGKIQSNFEKARDFGSGIMRNIGGFGPISFLANKLDKFGSLPTADQEFIKMNMGYTGPTVFGENTSGLNKDPFGINTRSMFGNYGEFVDEEAAKMEEIVADQIKRGLTNTLQMKKLDFYRQKKKERDDVQKQTLKQQIADDKFYGGQGKSDPGDRSRTGATGRRPGSGGTVDRVESGGVAAGQNVDNTGQAYDSGGREGFGYGLKKGGLVSIL